MIFRELLSFFTLYTTTIYGTTPRNPREPVFEVVKRTDDLTGFKILPRRWVVERTFAWLGRYRRLSKDYEVLPETSEAFIYVAMVNLMLTRLARNPAVFL